MKILLQLEMVAVVVLSVWLFSMTGFVWWWFLVLFLAPDIGMVGYVAGTKVGAWAYNFTHHLGLATILIIIGATRAAFRGTSWCHYARSLSFRPRSRLRS